MRLVRKFQFLQDHLSNSLISKGKGQECLWAPVLAYYTMVEILTAWLSSLHHLWSRNASFLEDLQLFALSLLQALALQNPSSLRKSFDELGPWMGVLPCLWIRVAKLPVEMSF